MADFFILREMKKDLKGLNKIIQSITQTDGFLRSKIQDKIKQIDEMIASNYAININETRKEVLAIVKETAALNLEDNDENQKAFNEIRKRYVFMFSRKAKIKTKLSRLNFSNEAVDFSTSLTALMTIIGLMPPLTPVLAAPSGILLCLNLHDYAKLYKKNQNLRFISSPRSILTSKVNDSSPTLEALFLTNDLRSALRQLNEEYLNLQPHYPSKASRKIFRLIKGYIDSTDTNAQEISLSPLIDYLKNSKNQNRKMFKAFKNVRRRQVEKRIGEWLLDLSSSDSLANITEKIISFYEDDIKKGSNDFFISKSSSSQHLIK